MFDQENPNPQITQITQNIKPAAMSAPTVCSNRLLSTLTLFI
jgi:hypothetical protein